MGPLGWQETVFIFILALLIFGPKKLPELGKTIGKAMTEFRRASSELKATFDREMKSLERENESLKEVTNQYQHDTYNYDYTSYDSGYYGESNGDVAHASGVNDSTATDVSTISASATQGAESEPAVTPEGTVPHGTEAAAAAPKTTEHPVGTSTGNPAESPAAEHKA